MYVSVGLTITLRHRGYEVFYLLGYNAEYSVEIQPTFQKNMSPKPSWQSLPHVFTLVSCSAYSLTLNMEALCSSEMLIDFQMTTRRCIPEDRTVHNHCCEDIRSVRIDTVHYSKSKWQIRCIHPQEICSSTRMRQDNTHPCNAQVDTIFGTLKLVVSVHKEESSEG
jgi:hypothetical protein